MEYINKHQLFKVAYDNQRDNQIGGQTDGIDSETACDLGYTLPEDVPALVDRDEDRKNAEQLEADQKAIEAAKRVIEEGPVQKEREPANLLNPNLPGREQAAYQVLNTDTFVNGAGASRMELERAKLRRQK